MGTGDNPTKLRGTALTRVTVALWTSVQGLLEEGKNGFTHDRNKEQNIITNKLHLIIETHKPQWDILLNTHKR